jgi:putative flippase GtrA
MTSLVTRAEHLWEKRDTPEARKLFRYTMVSVISTGVSFLTLAIVFGLLHLWGEVVSTVFANVVASVPSYFLTRNWVWGKTGRSHLVKEIIPFWAMSALGIIFSIFGAAIAKHIGKEYHLTHLEQTVVVLIANVLSFAVFWVAKFLVFNRIFKVHPVEELDDLVEAA